MKRLLSLLFLCVPTALFAAGPPSKLICTSSPRSGAAHSNLGNQYAFEVVDAEGNVCTSDYSMVTLSITSGPDDDFGPCTFPEMKCQQGRVTFSQMLYYVAGTYVVTASDGSLPDVTLPPITIGPGAAEQVDWIDTPSTGTVGHPLSGVVGAIEDKDDNAETGDNSSTMTASLCDASGAVFASQTVTVVKGEATFNNLVPPAAGTYRLKLTCSALPASFSGVAWSDQAGIPVK